MENDYITIKDAVGAVGKSEETIRRWIRMVRGQYRVNLDDDNDQLEEKNAPLRKRNLRNTLHQLHAARYTEAT